MKVLVTGSSGHLGEALMRVLPAFGHEPVGLDITPGPFTTHVGSITDCAAVRRAMGGAAMVLHTATLHKPHVATHSRRDFVETNISGTLMLLEEALSSGVSGFVFTSTTSVFGAALSPAAGEPAAWIDEKVSPIPKNIYGTTKTAAEDLCTLFASRHGLKCIILRTSRFFPEADDSSEIRDAYDDTNAKANEFLHRRVDIEDVASAHERAMYAVSRMGFGRYVISATTPFRREDLNRLRNDPAGVVASRFPDFERIYAKRGFRMFPDIGRVYDNERARRELGWQPKYDFAKILGQIGAGRPIGSDLSRIVGIKGYHSEVFRDGPYPVE